MQVMTDSEIRQQLSQLSELRCEGKEVRFTHAEAQRILIDLRLPEPHQLLFLARLVSSLLFEEKCFDGAYLWITLWGVWDTNVEAVAFNALERYRQGFGENRPVTSAPGHVFRANEFVNSVACLVQPMLVGWDAFFIPKEASGELEYFVFVSHDSFIDIETRTNSAHQKAMEILKGFDWLKIDRGPSRLDSGDGKSGSCGVQSA